MKELCSTARRVRRHNFSYYKLRLIFYNEIIFFFFCQYCKLTGAKNREVAEFSLDMIQAWGETFLPYAAKFVFCQYHFYDYHVFLYYNFRLQVREYCARVSGFETGEFAVQASIRRIPSSYHHPTVRAFYSSTVKFDSAGQVKLASDNCIFHFSKYFLSLFSY